MNEFYCIEIKASSNLELLENCISELPIHIKLLKDEVTGEAIFSQVEVSTLGGFYLSSVNDNIQTYLIDFTDHAEVVEQEVFLQEFSTILKQANVSHRIIKSNANLDEEYDEVVGIYQW